MIPPGAAAPETGQQSCDQHCETGGPVLPSPPRAGRLSRFGRPRGKDVVSGFVTGLFSIPEGMAYASIGGFNPVLGLYSGMAPTVVGLVMTVFGLHWRLSPSPLRC